MNYKVKGTDKDLFLKPLEKLFGLENSMFSFENTVIVDDSLVKQVTNFPWGVLLLEAWTYKGHGPTDRFLIDELLPWFQRLHISRPQSLCGYKKDNNLGRLHLSQEDDKEEYEELAQAVRESNSLYDEWRVNNPKRVVLFEESDKAQHTELEFRSLERAE